ncbi:Translation protein SH3-like domain [Pseudocohnilembus persalinus]|uniref:Large ribosomal subunit protein uL24c n=1 Tax=Pseudocohnilembus persalinus TaxID=266149 RepID=A0A0V0QC15_PSEPJ|nr:Translation protein SH3-like domain [Pseudocohnilembus persalinus]|eukprot:KRW99675.1 Translation protein SH3-like domain [Pseudocohnilembus persalinus]
MPQFNFGNSDGKRKTSYQVPFKRWQVIKGDNVIVITGKDKNKSGRVLKVYRKTNKVLIEGINIKMKRFRQDPEQDLKGGIKHIIHPIHVSNVQLIDPETGKPTRIRFGYLADGTKVRLSKKSGSIIEKHISPAANPAVRNKNKIDGIKDTPTEQALEVTYKGEEFSQIKQEFEDFIREKQRKEKLLVFSE